jgi:hypothetical protein
LDSREETGINPAVLVDVKQYYLMIYGTIPEIGKLVAFRRTRQIQQKQSCDRKLIKCPYCDARLTDTEQDSIVEVFTLPAPRTVQLYLKCTRCRQEIGVCIVIRV